jgi:hypothetical protein
MDERRAAVAHKRAVPLHAAKQGLFETIIDGKKHEVISISGKVAVD